MSDNISDITGIRGLVGDLKLPNPTDVLKDSLKEWQAARAWGIVSESLADDRIAAIERDLVEIKDKGP